jgi:predicted pyridoxine 5'-phosphate oxidase superfamily flavin-nucleotide-binding protein
MRYFTEILKTFSTAQRIWALIILCISVFFITFGSDIIGTLKPDPTQQNLVVQRQKKEITSLNTQLDSLTLKVDDLTQEVINGQSECSNKRIQREKEIITQIDELQNMLRSSLRPKAMVKEPEDDGLARDEVKVIQIDNTDIVISALSNLKNKIKNKK